MATKTKTKPRKKSGDPKPIEVPPDVEAALSVAKIGALLSCSRRTVYRMISEGTFPKPDFYLSKSLPRWHKETFNAFYRGAFRKDS